MPLNRWTCPDCDPDRLERTYRQFALVNRALSGWRGALPHGNSGPLLSRRLRHHPAGYRLRRRRPARAARPVGRPGRAAAAGHRHRPGRAGQPLRRRTATPAPACSSGRRTAAELVAGGPQLRRRDFQPCAPPPAAGELQPFLADSPALARRDVLHNDLRRSAGSLRAVLRRRPAVPRFLHPRATA